MGKLKWNAGQIVNDTSDYELAQYPATDKPRYLVDYDFKDTELLQLHTIIDKAVEYIENIIERFNKINDKELISNRLVDIECIEKLYDILRGDE